MVQQAEMEAAVPAAAERVRDLRREVAASLACTVRRRAAESRMRRSALARFCWRVEPSASQSAIRKEFVDLGLRGSWPIDGPSL